MPRTIQVLRDEEIVDVDVDDDVYEEHERFLDPGATEGEQGRARILPVIDDKGAEWTVCTFREDEDEPYTTTLHEFPTGVTDCRIPHMKAKRLFDRADKIMNEFEFLDDDRKETIEEILWG